ncbi:uncharacterized protein LOC130561467 [Triplophysa rosa]|uniref:uncharacterized protein LOC130561467 n=1 Tax=Triplophysa rosa TaxID=992332 RepID=UPI002545C969|nr:uncharacterized protein LOC130561467 [Triplophysa rosa]
MSDAIPWPVGAVQMCACGIHTQKVTFYHATTGLRLRQALFRHCISQMAVQPQVHADQVQQLASASISFWCSLHSFDGIPHERRIYKKQRERVNCTLSKSRRAYWQPAIRLVISGTLSICNRAARNKHVGVYKGLHRVLSLSVHPMLPTWVKATKRLAKLYGRQSERLKHSSRSRQGLNLRGETPMDFKCIALTTRPRLQQVQCPLGLTRAAKRDEPAGNGRCNGDVKKGQAGSNQRHKNSTWCPAMTRIRTGVAAATTQSTNHYTIDFLTTSALRGLAGFAEVSRNFWCMR